MKKQKIFNNSGLTLVELLVVIGIMATLSVLFIISIRLTTQQRFAIDVDTFANDVRYIRNLSASKAVYNGEYPGSYGIQINNGNGTTIASRYILYAGSPNNVIKSVTLSNASFRMGDFNNINSITNNNWSGRLEFVDEKNISVNNIILSPAKQYQVFLQYPVSNGYNRAVLLLGEQSNDSFIWANVGYDNSFIPSQCGNCLMDPGEQCDDCNTNNDDGCRSNCTTIPSHEDPSDPIFGGQ